MQQFWHKSGISCNKSPYLARPEGHQRHFVSKGRAVQLAHKLGQLGVRAAGKDDLQWGAKKR